MKRIDMSKARKNEVEIDGVKFTIKPMPFSRYTVPDYDESGEPVFTMRTAWSLFDGCVVSWEGLEDQNGEPIPVTQANKQYIFDYVDEIRTPLVDEIAKLNKSAEEEVKNSPSSQSGKTTKTKVK